MRGNVSKHVRVINETTTISTKASNVEKNLAQVGSDEVKEIQNERVKRPASSKSISKELHDLYDFYSLAGETKYTDSFRSNQQMQRVEQENDSEETIHQAHYYLSHKEKKQFNQELETAQVNPTLTKKNSHQIEEKLAEARYIAKLKKGQRLLNESMQTNEYDVVQHENTKIDERLLREKQVLSEFCHDTKNKEVHQSESQEMSKHMSAELGYELNRPKQMFLNENIYKQDVSVVKRRGRKQIKQEVSVARPNQVLLNPTMQKVGSNKDEKHLNIGLKDVKSKKTHDAIVEDQSDVLVFYFKSQDAKVHQPQNQKVELTKNDVKIDKLQSMKSSKSLNSTKNKAGYDNEPTNRTKSNHNDEQTSHKMTSVNQSPTISALDKKLFVNDVFNPFLDISARDYQDGDLTDVIEILENTVDMTKAGVYKVTYQVKNSRNQTAEKSIAVNVANQIEIVNEKIILTYQEATATSFDPTQYIKIKADYVSDFVMTLYSGEIKPVFPDVNTILEYPFVFHVSDSQGRVRTLKENIYVSNFEPVMEGLSDVEIVEGESFDLMNGVKATDVEDGDLTDKITINQANFNPYEEGRQDVIYKVTDSDGNTTVKQRTIIVRRGTKLPIIEIIEGSEFDALKSAMQLEMKSPKAITSIEVKLNTVNHNQIGSYTVIYDIQYDDQKSSTRPFTVVVKSKELPLIIAEDMTLFAFDEFDALLNVTAVDRANRDITSAVEVETHDVDTTVAGIYTVVYSVTDSYFNQTKHTRKVTVKARQDVFIKGIEKFSNQYISTRQATHFDPLENVSLVTSSDKNVNDFEILVTGELEALKNSKQPVKGELSTYKLVYTVKKGEEIVCTTHRNVSITNYSPIITGADDLTLKKGQAYDLLEGVKVEDFEDGVLTSRISVDPRNFNINLPGTYSIRYSSTDSDKNTQILNRIITVTA